MRAPFNLNLYHDRRYFMHHDGSAHTQKKTRIKNLLCVHRSSKNRIFFLFLFFSNFTRAIPTFRELLGRNVSYLNFIES